LHEKLWQKLVMLDPQNTAQRSKCQFISDPNRYVLTFLNSQYSVNIDNKLIISLNPAAASGCPGYLEQLCLLTYLIHARDMAPSGRLVRPQALPDGEFFFRGSHALPTTRLQEVCGAEPALLIRAAGKLAAVKSNYGDASITLQALPQVPLTFIVWASDDEFPARASVLFDETAAEQLPLDALLATVKLAVNLILDTISHSD
jgi:hypothetical protein